MLEFESYKKTLRGEDRGVVDEFVNPKYKDDAKTVFKKPTRLECMMQDYPKLLRKTFGGRKARVGFVSMDRWLTFSPAKNSLPSGVEAVAAGSSAPGTLSSSESDAYIANQRKLMELGVKISGGDDVLDASIGGIPVTMGPRVVLSQHFGLTKKDLKQSIVNGGIISRRSSLVIEGLGDVILDGIELDGALVIKTVRGVKLTLKKSKIVNKGWKLRELTGEERRVEELSIRGYALDRVETKLIDIKEEGDWECNEDGDIVKL